MNEPILDERTQIESMVTDLLDKATSLPPNWYKAGDGCAYVERARMLEDGDVLRLVYTTDSVPNETSMYSHFVVDSAGDVLVSFDTQQDEKSWGFVRAPNDIPQYRPHSAEASYREPASACLTEILSYIPHRNADNYEGNLVELLQSWGAATPPRCPSRPGYRAAPSLGSQRALMEIGINTAARIVEQGTSQLVPIAYDYLVIAARNLVEVAKGAEQLAYEDLTTLRHASEKIVELAESVKQLHELDETTSKLATLDPELARRNFTSSVDHVVIESSCRALARLEDLQESLWSGSLATPSPTNWREEARKDKILERAVPRIQELDAERFAELKAENPDLQASYSSLDAIFLVEWNGHHELPHGLMIRGYPLAKLNAHMVFDQSSVDLVGNAVHDGIRYQRITWYGGEQGNLQVLLFSVPLQGPDSTVSVDVEASKSANEFLLDDWWSSSSPSSVYPRKL